MSGSKHPAASNAKLQSLPQYLVHAPGYTPSPSKRKHAGELHRFSMLIPVVAFAICNKRVVETL